MGQGVCFLVDSYFLSSVFLFCFPCMVGTSTGTACDGSWGQWERRWVKDSRLGQCKWNRRYFCPLMDCDIDRGGIMSKRYSRCRSARLGALCPPIPVFKYAMLTPRPRRQKWRQVLKEEMIPSSAIPWGCSLGDAEGTVEVVYIHPDSIKLYFSNNYPPCSPALGREAFPKLQTYQD